MAGLPGDAGRVVLEPGQRAFDVAAGESILEAGRRAGYSFPQACRNGNCFRCEGRLLAGEVEHLRTHARQDAADGAAPVLPCIVTALGDCTIAVDGVYGPGELPVVEAAAQVVAVETLNHDVARVRLRLPAGRPVARLAGQYLEIVGEDQSYAFSIASAPASGRELELHVRFGEANPSSLAVLALLRREPVVRLRLPLGDCTLVVPPRLPLLLVVGSTGFAQAKAFIEHAIAQGWQLPVTLYWGARTRADLYLDALARAWADEFAWFRYVPVVSEEPAGDDRRGGLVHEAVLADRARFDDVLVYACGSPGMVYAVQDALVARGLPPERIFSDVFAWAPRPS